MAGIVYFKKLSEDDQQVRYRFGEEHANMHRVLIVNKATARPEPEDGQADYEFRRVAGKIVIAFDDEGEWRRSTASTPPTDSTTGTQVLGK